MDTATSYENLVQQIDSLQKKLDKRRQAEDKYHLSFEAQFRAGSGQEIPMLFSRSTVKDDMGRPNGYMYFLTDLTELKVTQRELKRAEHRYRSMYQNAVQGMFQSRLSGELIRVNKQTGKDSIGISEF